MLVDVCVCGVVWLFACIVRGVMSTCFEFVYVCVRLCRFVCACVFCVLVHVNACLCACSCVYVFVCGCHNV